MDNRRLTIPGGRGDPGPSLPPRRATDGRLASVRDVETDIVANMRHPRRAAGAVPETDALDADAPEADAPEADDRAAGTAALVALFREHQLGLARTALMIVGDRATAED